MTEQPDHPRIPIYVLIEGPRARRENPDGTERRDFYVYVHRDVAGNVFYVGKGTARRAWSKERDEFWRIYVDEYLGGRYEVEIVQSDLGEMEALVGESELVRRYSDQLVNRGCGAVGFELYDKYHALRRANLDSMTEIRALEKSDAEEAVRRYRKALENMRQYESMELHTGVMAKLMRRMPRCGDVVILDRLTLCLSKLGRGAEAIAESETYFREFPSALRTCIGQKIVKRTERLRRK
jgi:hypothetical protein